MEQPYYIRHMRAIWMAIALALFFTAAYAVITPSIASQEGDSLMYGYHAETDGIRAIWGNHPLGHIVFNTAFLIGTSLGYSGRALVFFQVLNHIIGAAAIALIFTTAALMLGNSLLSSLLLAVILGTSYRFWYFAGNSGNIYGLAFLFALLAWISLLNAIFQSQRRVLVLPSVVVGLAILTHQLNDLLLVVGLILIIREGRFRVPRAISFLGLTGFIVVLGYLMAGYLSGSTTSLASFIAWAHGYVGNPSWGRFLSLSSMGTTWSSLTGVLINNTYSGFRFNLIRTLLLLPYGLALLWGVTHLLTLNHMSRLILIAGAAQFLVAFLLIWWWDPSLPQFWLLAWVPLLFVFMAISETVEKAIKLLLSHVSVNVRIVPYGGLSLSVIGVIILNLSTGVIPDHNRVNGGAVWIDHSSKDSLLITPWYLAPYLQYWGDRSHTVYLPPESELLEKSDTRLARLKLQINAALCEGNTVLYTPLALDVYPDNQWEEYGVPKRQFQAFFDAYNRQEAFTYELYGNQVIVYSLVGPKQCSSSN
jgi:hypothetical protein